MNSFLVVILFLAGLCLLFLAGILIGKFFGLDEFMEPEKKS